MAPIATARSNDGPTYVASVMPSKAPTYVIGIDVGGTNTDSVILQHENVLAWHKTPTTSDIQKGVEAAIEAVIKEAKVPSDQVASVKIGTTQFVNAVLEQDSSKLDKVAVIRLCGPYSRGSPPFVDFPSKLRQLMQGHVGFVDGGYQVDGVPISPLNIEQLKEQAALIKSKIITSVVVIGTYSPTNPTQEEDARKILSKELGAGYDVSCSHAVGRLGFLERENASILNASLRRFARHVIKGFTHAVRRLGGKPKLYITLNDGTLSTARTAADYPVRCFSSGPTNSARGAALLARTQWQSSTDDREVLVVDVGGTTTDICALLKTGYPRQSAAFVKIAGVRTNFTIPDVHSIALGGGSLVRVKDSRTSVGPDSVGAKLEQEALAFGGKILTATDLVFKKDGIETYIASEVKESGLLEISRALDAAIDLVKTKQGDAKVILVGGGSIIISDKIAGVGQIIRPRYLEVANAVGAAIAKVSGTVDKTVVPGEKTIDQELEAAKSLAKERCVAAGGNRSTIEVVEIDVVPMSYVTNGATRLIVRVVGDLLEGFEEPDEIPSPTEEAFSEPERQKGLPNGISDELDINAKGSSYDIVEHIDIKSYRPRIQGDFWYVSELDLQFLQDGTGVLGVGSCGEPYPAYIACLLALRNGENITIRRQDTFPDDAVLLVAGFMGSPSVYLERIPGLNEVTDAMKGVMKASGLSTFDAVVPNEIGGMNSFEALIAAGRFGKSVLDTDLVARAYPKIWQTVRCLKDVPVAPAAVSDGAGKTHVWKTVRDNLEAEDVMRDMSTDLGSLCGMCINPVSGLEAKTLPKNSFSHAWMIGRSIALSRSLKQDPIISLLENENGVLLFTGKIISVTRHVSDGFTRGSVLLESFSDSESSSIISTNAPHSLLVDFENENLSAVLKGEGREDKVLAVCPDLITFLDKANGAPLGISDYKYGLRVSVVALRAPPVWATEKGLETGGPRAFGLDCEYKPVTEGEYDAPKSVWELFGEGASGEVK